MRSHEPLTLQAIAIALDYAPEFDGKFLLLKITISLNQRTWWNRAGTDWSAIPIATIHSAGKC